VFFISRFVHVCASVARIVVLFSVVKGFLSCAE